jgi:hypothetical protein
LADCVTLFFSSADERSSEASEPVAIGFRADRNKNNHYIGAILTFPLPGNSLSFHDDMAFSTVDSDNDYSMRNCADDNKSGWWFSSCLTSNLNGVYHQTGWYTQQQQQQQPQQQDGTAGSQVGSSDQHSDGTGSMQGVGRGSTGGGPNPDGIVWFTLKETDYYSLKRVEMKIKPSA